jgi:hypothetical protein
MSDYTANLYSPRRQIQIVSLDAYDETLLGDVSGSPL